MCKIAFGSTKWNLLVLYRQLNNAGHWKRDRFTSERESVVFIVRFPAPETMSRGHDNILCDTVYRCSCIYVCKGTCGCCQGADSPIRWLRSYVTLIQVPQKRLYILLSMSRVVNTSPTHNWLARRRQVPVNRPLFAFADKFATAQDQTRTLRIPGLLKQYLIMHTL